MNANGSTRCRASFACVGVLLFAPWFAPMTAPPWAWDASRAESQPLRDGVHQGRTLGYTADVVVTIRVKNGRIDDVFAKHEDAMDLGAGWIIPRRIADLQTTDVDAITGATVTSEAIVEAAESALKKARR